MKVKMADLQAGYLPIKQEIDDAISKVLTRTDFILGEDVTRFENEFAAYCRTKYAVGVASGTDALKIALLAAGIEKGSEVITTPFTFIATAGSIVHAGGKPVFADIKADTFNIDPKEIEKKITKNTKAILPVHLYGQPAEMDEIIELARKNNLKVIEDCAQAFTAKYGEAPVGSMGDAGAYSFFPSKNLGCFGDGGMIATNDKSIYDKCLSLRNHGQKERYSSDIHGYNSRLDTIQAAVLSVKLRYIDEWTGKRNAIARKYSDTLRRISTTVPVVKENCRHSFNYYTIRFKNSQLRDAVQKQLAENGVGCQVYYPKCLHLQPVYSYLGYKKGDMPVSERIQDEVLSLPMYPEMTDEQVEYVISNVIKGCTI